MHTEYGVPEVKEQQPRSFARDCINQKRRVVAIAGSKNSRRVSQARLSCPSGVLDSGTRRIG